jgi:AraC-like DNA-binding protein
MQQHFLTDKSSIFTRTAPAVVSAYVAHHVVTHDLQLLGSDTDRAYLRHRRVGTLDLCQVAFATESRVTARAPDNIYLLHILLNGSCQAGNNTGSPTRTKGDLNIFNPQALIDLIYSRDGEALLIRIPANFFSEICRENGWSSSDRDNLFATNTLRCRDQGNLPNLLALICKEVESSMATTQILQHYNQALVCKLLEISSNPRMDNQDNQQSDCFRRIVNYIEQNIKDEISLEELARQANISLRSLYVLFKKNANTTPKNFIRLKKLEQVYATLMNPARNFINVTEVALNYGFTHLGRFSEFYKATYGMLPSEAIHSRAPESAMEHLRGADK